MGRKTLRDSQADLRKGQFNSKESHKRIAESEKPTANIRLAHSTLIRMPTKFAAHRHLFERTRPRPPCYSLGPRAQGRDPQPLINSQALPVNRQPRSGLTSLASD